MGGRLELELATVATAGERHVVRELMGSQGKRGEWVSDDIKLRS